jgi:hypothetical protein
VVVTTTGWTLPDVVYSASTAVIVRMAFIHRFHDPDFLFATVDIAIWSDIEQGLAITAGSLATLRPLYRLVVEKLGLSQAGTQPLKESELKKTPVPYSNSRQPINKKRGGPFSLMSMSRNEDEEEYGLGDCPPIPLRDEVSNGAADRHRKNDTSFASWTIQGGEARSDRSSGNGSEDELNRSRGIMKHKEVFMTSEVK